MRPAFTVVELLVALVVLAVGVLSLAATAGGVAAQLGDGARFTAAAHLARSVLDSLAARPCAALVSGRTATAAAVVEWVVDGDSARVAVELSIIVATRRGERRQSVRALVPCDAA